LVKYKPKGAIVVAAAAAAVFYISHYDVLSVYAAVTPAMINQSYCTATARVASMF